MPAKPSLNIHQRLHAAMKEVSYVQKDAKLAFGKGASKPVVTHDAVTAKVRPALVEVGVIYYPQNLLVTQDGNRTELRFDVRFVNIDDPDDHIDVPTIGYGVDQSDKGPGKALSYGVKMALLKALGLETGEDADLEHKNHKPGVDPRDGAGIPAPKVPVKLDLVSPFGEVEGTYSDPKKYMTELANLVKDDGNYWMENVLNVDWIEDNFPQHKKWVHKLRKLGTTAHDNAQAAKAEAALADDHIPEQKWEKEAEAEKDTAESAPAPTSASKTETAPPSEPRPADKADQKALLDAAKADIPPFLARRMKFQLLSPKGTTETFTDPKKFLQALEAKMLTDPVTWWESNYGTAKLIAENDPESKSWVDGLLDMATEAGKENPLAAG